MRPEPQRWADWRDGQIDKVRTSLQALEQAPQQLQGRVDIGTLSLACALGYLDLRYDAWGWRGRFPPWPSGPKVSCSGRRCWRCGRPDKKRYPAIRRRKDAAAPGAHHGVLFNTHGTSP